MPLTITALQPEHVPTAAGLYAENFQRLHQRAPLLPSTLEDPAFVAEKLGGLARHASCLAAWDGDRLVGFLGWFLVDGFRRTPRRGAYMPEWAHTTVEGDRRPTVYRALYRAASAQFAPGGAGVHAITLLAGEPDTEQTWYWSGFGLTVVDAIRPTEPIGAPLPAGLVIRRAVPADAPRLAQIDSEHCLHYTQPPIFMALPPADSAEHFAGFVTKPGNTIWIAEDGDHLAGFMRFQTGDYDGVELLNAPGMVGCNGAYVRPAYRGRGIAPALLDAALTHYAAQGIERLSVNFESLNPEASSFWMRYFEPAAWSLTRVPETGAE